MTQAQPLGARDLPDHQYGKALAAKWMKGMGYLGRSQSLAGLEGSSKQPCRRSPIAWHRQSQRWCWSRRWNQSSTPTLMATVPADLRWMRLVWRGNGAGHSTGLYVW